MSIEAKLKQQENSSDWIRKIYLNSIHLEKLVIVIINNIIKSSIVMIIRRLFSGMLQYNKAIYCIMLEE